MKILPKVEEYCLSILTKNEEQNTHALETRYFYEMYPNDQLINTIK